MDCNDEDENDDEVDNTDCWIKARQLYAWREGIASAMWVDYQAELIRGG